MLKGKPFLTRFILSMCFCVCVLYYAHTQKLLNY